MTRNKTSDYESVINRTIENLKSAILDGPIILSIRSLDEYMTEALTRLELCENIRISWGSDKVRLWSED